MKRMSFEFAKRKANSTLLMRNSLWILNIGIYLWFFICLQVLIFKILIRWLMLAMCFFLCLLNWVLISCQENYFFLYITVLSTKYVLATCFNWILSENENMSSITICSLFGRLNVYEPFSRSKLHTTVWKVYQFSSFRNFRHQLWWFDYRTCNMRNFNCLADLRDRWNKCPFY